MNILQDPASLQIVWSRMIAICEEMFTTVWRTAFTPLVAIIQDHGCELLDADGNCIAHAPSSMPAFNLTIPLVTRAVLAEYPRAQMRPGDVFITNNPWLSAGHLPDICVVTPVFRNGEVIAFCGTIAHANDIGGTNDDRRPRSVYEEGLQIPILKLYSEGCRNETLYRMLLANVRGPDEVIGDLEALVSANAVGANRLNELLTEYNLDDVSSLSAEIQRRTETAARAAISSIPDGVYRAVVPFDGMGDPLTIRVAITVTGESMHVDYTGTSPQVERGGINATLAYTQAQTFYALMCALTPQLPNNEGSLRPLTIEAPAGSILNCQFPAPVNLRLRSGWHLNTAIYAALGEVLPSRVMAGSGFLAAFQARGRRPDGTEYNVPFFAGGGQGASLGRDGRAGYIFPSTAAGMSVEQFENRAPILIHSKALLCDSGGPGQWRGGPGQRIIISPLPAWPEPIEIVMTPDRMLCPAPGLAGGQPGSPSRVAINGIPPAPGGTFYTEGYVTLNSDQDTLLWDLPGGGGYGAPAHRSSDALDRDLSLGLVSPEAAATAYGRSS